jgi:CspA family cold shock protein
VPCSLYRKILKARKQAMPETKLQGTVKWFNVGRGFGFISPTDGGKDVFVHFMDIIGDGYRSLNEADRVEYQVKQGKKGIQATNVVKVAE